MRNRTWIAVGALLLTFAVANLSAQTTGKLPKYLTSTTFGDSVVSENAGQIGIGGSPGQKLEVFGAIRGHGNHYLTEVTWGNGFLADDGAGATLFSLTRQTGGANGNTTRIQSLGDFSFASGLVGSPTEVMHVNGWGWVTVPQSGLSVGTSTQAGILNVVGGANQWAQFTRSGKLLYVNANYSDQNQFGYLGMHSGENMGLALSSTDAHPEYMFISPAGRVGIGTTTPNAQFHVLSYGAGEQVRMSLSAGTGYNLSVAGDAVAVAMDTYNGGAYPLKLKAIQTQNAPNYPNDDFAIVTNTNGADTERLRVLNNGNVGIGLTNPAYTLDVNGTIHATNVIGASYQDVAEWVPAGESLDPGTVVVLDHTHRNQVLASKAAYDTGVAGVVSAQPGIILGIGAPDKAQVATTGRVKVKVDATRAPVRIGDLLVTSDMAGTAMRSVPVEVAGIQMHRPGTIIGKALEPLDSGTGEILVLLSLQ